MASKKLKIKEIPGLLKETGKAWMAKDPFGKSASVAYYAIFSLPALLIIIVTIAGAVFGEEAVRGYITEQFSGLIGAESAGSIETIIEKSKTEDNSIWASIVGIIVLIVGATGLFIQLQKTINDIWDVEPKPTAGLLKMLTDRATSLGIVIAIGFLLMISLVITTVISLISDWIVSNLPEVFLYLAFALNFILSLAAISLLFAAIYKVLPDVNIEWSSVWVGSIITGLLFQLGNFLIGLYLGIADPGSAFGAAGSIILVLLWVSYSCMIVFFGAEFTQQYSIKYGHKIKPSSHARYTAAYRIKHNMVNDVKEVKNELKGEEKKKD